MEIRTKYNIGDMVKVISPKKEEFILRISRINILVDDNRTTTEYNSDYYMDTDVNPYGDTYTHYLPIVESKEDTNDCPVAYIKCAVDIVELNR